MSSLVNLDIKLPEWGKPSGEVFIGKDILELLSTSMYVEPLSMYREYIQNSADSLDENRTRPSDDLSVHDVEIFIDRQERNIKIRDRGMGLPQNDFYSKTDFNRRQ